MGETFKSVMPAHAQFFKQPDGSEIPYSYQLWVEHIVNNDPAFNQSVAGLARATRLIGAIAGKPPAEPFEWIHPDAFEFARAVCRALTRPGGFIQLVPQSPDVQIPQIPNMRFAGYVAASIPDDFEEPPSGPATPAPAVQAA